MSKTTKGKPIGCYIKLIQPELILTEIKLVIPAREKPGVEKALRDIRALFGKNGQNWIQGAEHEHTEAGEYSESKDRQLTKVFDGYCLIGGVHEVDGRYEQAARAAIAMAIAEQQDMALKSRLNALEDVVEVYSEMVDAVDIITEFNDAQAHWSAIKSVLARAVKLVKQADTK